MGVEDGLPTFTTFDGRGQVEQAGPGRLDWDGRLGGKNQGVGIIIVTIEILTFGIAVHTYVGIQTNWFAAPEVFKILVFQYGLSQPRAFPQPGGEGGIVYLEAIVDAHCLATLGARWRRL